MSMVGHRACTHNECILGGSRYLVIFKRTFERVIHRIKQTFGRASTLLRVLCLCGEGHSNGSVGGFTKNVY